MPKRERDSADDSAAAEGTNAVKKVKTVDTTAPEKPTTEPVVSAPDAKDKTKSPSGDKPSSFLGGADADKSDFSFFSNGNSSAFSWSGEGKGSYNFSFDSSGDKDGGDFVFGGKQKGESSGGFASLKQDKTEGSGLFAKDGDESKQPEAKKTTAEFFVEDVAISREFEGRTAVASGEEGEDTVAKGRAKMFALVSTKRKKAQNPLTIGSASASASADSDTSKTSDDKSDDGAGSEDSMAYVERGTGELRLNKYEKDGKSRYRLVLRVDNTHRVVLNAHVLPAMHFQKKDKGNFVQFIGVNFAEPGGDGVKPTVHLLKFATSGLCASMFSSIEKAVSTVAQGEKKEK